MDLQNTKSDNNNNNNIMTNTDIDTKHKIFKYGIVNAICALVACGL